MVRLYNDVVSSRRQTPSSGAALTREFNCGLSREILKIDNRASLAGAGSMLATRSVKSKSGVRVDPVIAGIAAFFLVHMLIRLFGTSNFSVDEASIAVFTQVFRFIYVPANPPLFDWMFLGLVRITGVNVLTMHILKTVLLTGAGIFFYLAIRPAFRHRVALHAAVAAYGTTIFYGWDIFQQFSHTVTLTFAMAFTLWAFLRVVRGGRLADYLALGVGLGLGVMAKYMFLLYGLALLVAGLRAKAYRPALLSPRLLLAIPAALVVLSPLLIGMTTAADSVFSELESRVAGSGRGVTLQSIGYFLALTAEFWLPFLAILAACLTRRPAVATEGKAEWDGDTDFYPFLRDASLLLFASVVVSFLALNTNVAEGRYLVGVLSLLPLAVIAAIDQRVDFPAAGMRRFWLSAMIFIAAVAALRFLLFLFTAPPFCVPRCVVFVDYRPVVAAVPFDPTRQNVIVTSQVHIGANLLRLVPNARVLVGGLTQGKDIGIAGPEARDCYLAWFERYPGTLESRLDKELRRAFGREPTAAELALVGPPDYVAAGWQTRILGASDPAPVLGIAKVASSAEICGGNPPEHAPNAANG